MTQAQKWRQIKTAPRDRKFLAWNGEQVYFGEYLNGRTFISQGLSGGSSPPPTHWMPLPEPPAKA